MKSKVLITTSGLGSRLGDLTQYTNKSLVRVGSKPILSYILENYPIDTEFVITLGYKGDLVRQFIEVAHSNLKITFVEIDPYEGEGSSLLYSMSCASSKLQCPFIFHSGDTIVKEKIAIDFTSNWVGAGTKGDSSIYRTLKISSQHNVSKVNDKGSMDYDYIHIGLIGIKDYELFWKCAFNYLNNTKQSDLSDVHIIEKMLEEKSEFYCVLFPSWLDAGNIQGLLEARKQIWDKIVLLDKTDQSVFVYDNKIVKFFANSEQANMRVQRGDYLKGIVPNIITATKNFYSYEKAEGKMFSEEVYAEQFGSFLEWCYKELWLSDLTSVSIKEINNFKQTCRDFYLYKTFKRLEMFVEKTGIQDREELVNGIWLPNTSNLLWEVNWDKICLGLPTTKYHGDLHGSNIFQTGENEWKLIDWRESFGDSILLGDVYYDLAKLNHGLLVSHDLIDKNLFTIEYDNTYIKVDILTKYNLIQCQNVLKEFCKKYNYSWDKVEILTALIYLNIAALHHHPYDIFLYYFGKKMLYDLLNKGNKND